VYSDRSITVAAQFRNGAATVTAGEVLATIG
jgi:hypothetical protein